MPRPSCRNLTYTQQHTQFFRPILILGLLMGTCRVMRRKTKVLGEKTDNPIAIHWILRSDPAKQATRNKSFSWHFLKKSRPDPTRRQHWHRPYIEVWHVGRSEWYWTNFGAHLGARIPLTNFVSKIFKDQYDPIWGLFGRVASRKRVFGSLMIDSDRFQSDWLVMSGKIIRRAPRRIFRSGAGPQFFSHGSHPSWGASPPNQYKSDASQQAKCQKKQIRGPIWTTLFQAKIFVTPVFRTTP